MRTQHWRLLRGVGGGLFEVLAEGETATNRPFMQANVECPLSVFRPDNFAIHHDIHVVFPFMVSASLTHVHSAHGRLLENFGLFVHALIHYRYTQSAPKM
jgi:hypothetical protein